MRDVDDHRAFAFAAEQPHLLAVAFRILGSDADAQDVVQEAWARFARVEVGDLRNVQAWLTTVVTRLCIDLLRRTHEAPQPPDEVGDGIGDDDGGPEEIAMLGAELTEAFVVLLDRLTPEQRVALVLHDVFGTPFDEVARLLATTPGSAKKLASRARGRLRSALPSEGRRTDVREARQVVSAFLLAAQEGDVDGLVALLHPAVSRAADPQALPVGAPQHVLGVEAVIAETVALQANARSARLATIGGRPGIVVSDAGEVVAALVVRVVDGRVRHYDVVADPSRLARLRIEAS